MATKALALFSGGLDSILACRVIAEQDIEVVALKFVTPFFDYALLEHQEQYKAEVLEKYNINVELVDLSTGYLKLLRSPVHGFGKNFNPCIDCKIMMLTRARELMTRFGADFLVTGEVVGQRPMSQRRDALQLIEREAGCADILVRPLSAQTLEPTKPELEGLVDRSRLLNLSGRGRKPQFKLAKGYGIKDFPNPAGGCLLTDSMLGGRIGRLYGGQFGRDAKDITPHDVNLLLVGRQFMVDNQAWLSVGRNQEENKRIASLYQPDQDVLLEAEGRPGPTGVLRHGQQMMDTEQRNVLLQAAGGVVTSLSKKVGGQVAPLKVNVRYAATTELLEFAPITPAQLKEWRVE
ncbi:MAG: thiamine biosynthesis protein [Desulfobulbus propionicus]|nr:MAG: thiamine biosynthesis protein [Desulfobulbus propionicus]